LDDIGTFKLTKKYLTLNCFIQKGKLYFSVSILEGRDETASIKEVNWQELKSFLKKNDFYRYEAQTINPKYFNLIEQLRTELDESKPKKINSQRRILILLKRLLVYKEALDLNELAKEFDVSHSQLVRDIAIIRSEFEFAEIRYNRIDHTYELK
jgi:hypothetical protein